MQREAGPALSYCSDGIQDGRFFWKGSPHDVHMMQIHAAAQSHNGRRVYSLCGSGREQAMSAGSCHGGPGTMYDDIHQALRRTTEAECGILDKAGPGVEACRGLLCGKLPPSICLSVPVMTSLFSLIHPHSIKGNCGDIHSTKSGVYILNSNYTQVAKWSYMFSWGCVFILRCQSWRNVLETTELYKELRWSSISFWLLWNLTYIWKKGGNVWVTM